MGVDTQLPGNGDEVLLEHLRRHDSGATPKAIGINLEGATLLFARIVVVRVDQDVGVEEATVAHGSRRGRRPTLGNGLEMFSKGAAFPGCPRPPRCPHRDLPRTLG